LQSDGVFARRQVFDDERRHTAALTVNGNCRTWRIRADTQLSDYCRALWDADKLRHMSTGRDLDGNRACLIPEGQLQLVVAARELERDRRRPVLLAVDEHLHAVGIGVHPA